MLEGDFFVLHNVRTQKKSSLRVEGQYKADQRYNERHLFFENNILIRTKVIMNKGKVYFDLLEAREKLKKNDVILYRVEQLYPFPAKILVKELKPYAKNAKFFWCQEEPKNMGAWFSVRDYIQWTLDTIKANNNKISYIGRSPDATPATGYAKRHISQQQEIVNKVFE